MNTELLIWLTPLPPLLAFVIIVLGVNRNKRLSYSIAVDAASLSWLASMIIFYRAITTEGLAEKPFQASINWLPIGSGAVPIGVLIDPLSAVTIFFVAWTVLMI